MNQENDKKLCKKFPLLYADRKAKPEVTAMCFGFECGDGWFDLIYELSVKLEKIIKNMLPIEKLYCKAAQVKEKFGTLRFYMFLPTAEIGELIDVAEKKSEKICELCGKKGKLRNNNSWLMVRCTKCWKLTEKI